MTVAFGVALAIVPLSAGTKLAAAEPERAKPQSVQVLAYGFPGIDERDLGVMFTADLQRVEGSPRLFDDKLPPKRVTRNALDKQLFRASETKTVDAGAQFLFVGLGIQQTDSRDALVFHSRMVKEVITLDSAAPRLSNAVPSDAVFYLSEVHIGTTVDLTAEVDYVGATRQLSLLFTQGSVRAKDVQAKTSSRVQLRALGLTDFSGDGAFAMTLDEIRSSFRSDPAPIELVFRTLPGKSYEPPKKIEREIDDAGVKIGEGKTHDWRLPPGKYKVIGASSPNGVTAAWSGIAGCDRAAQSETRRFETTCSVRTAATLTIKNPTGWGLGPEEKVDLVVARLPEQIEVADADQQKLIKWFDRLVVTTVGNSNNCNNMAAGLHSLIDGSSDVLELARRHDEKSPAWLTAYLNEGAKKMTPALQKCASNASVKAAFDRIAAKKR